MTARRQPQAVEKTAVHEVTALVRAIARRHGLRIASFRANWDGDSLIGIDFQMSLSQTAVSRLLEQVNTGDGQG